MSLSIFFLFPFIALAAGTGKSVDHFPLLLDASALKDGQAGRTQIEPCQNFYQFACGTWEDEAEIPADKDYVGRAYTALMDNIDKNLSKILESYAEGNFQVPAQYAQKLGNYYTSCMNPEPQVEAASKMALHYVGKLRAIKSKQELADTIGELNLIGAGAFFSFGSEQDPKNSTQVIAELSQGGLPLGTRDYYLKKDAKSQEILQKYTDYISQILVLSGENQDEAKNHAEKILALETKLAEHSYSITDAADPNKTTHPTKFSALAKLDPDFDWVENFRQANNLKVKSLNVDEPEFFTSLNSLLSQPTDETLHEYLVWRYVDTIASSIGGPFYKAHFAFWNKYLNGQAEPKPRWQVCTREIENNLGYALAESYINTFNGKAIKTQTEKMIAEIQLTFAAELEHLRKKNGGWMDDGTVNGALAKIKKMAQKVGGPTKWRNFDKLSITPASLLDNYIAASRFESLRQFAKIGKPVDKTEWQMMPWEVNAYYDRSNNEFNFPFGILQPPTVDLNVSYGANLGSFGGTIGHELTHGFDNNGAKYDAKGNLKNWWTVDTRKLFEKKGQCYSKQANAYLIEEVSLHVNGEQTLEENLADQNGVMLGYLALKKELAQRSPAPPWQGHYSELQQYWIAYAQSWCTKQKDESLRNQMLNDVHPPAEFRVNAVVMNGPEFAQDFGCTAGARLAPVERCSLW